MDATSVVASYRRYASLYNLFFGPSLGPGRIQTLRNMELKPGERILEIGVGTGLSLGLYPKDVKITGIDLSQEMLGQAFQRVAKMGLSNVELKKMDAQHLEFADDSFDTSVAMYVASVVPDPAQMVREIMRVTRPGGKIYIVNHFSRKGSVMSGIEKALSPLRPLLGFEPLFYLDDFLIRAGLRNVDDIPIKPFGYWRLLRMENNKPTNGQRKLGFEGQFKKVGFPAMAGKVLQTN
jgi:phosphatidylethanolamine/phosphatidyl-N-methylethanolamine N-methyltransferase